MKQCTPGTGSKEGVSPALKAEIVDAGFPERRDEPAESKRFNDPTKPRSERQVDRHIPKRADSGSGERSDERLMGRSAIRHGSRARSGGRR